MSSPSVIAAEMVHRAFFTREMTAAGLLFTEDMPVVCEEFEVDYR